MIWNGKRIPFQTYKTKAKNDYFLTWEFEDSFHGKTVIGTMYHEPDSGWKTREPEKVVLADSFLEHKHIENEHHYRIPQSRLPEWWEELFESYFKEFVYSYEPEYEDVKIHRKVAEAVEINFEEEVLDKQEVA